MGPQVDRTPLPPRRVRRIRRRDRQGRSAGLEKTLDHLIAGEPDAAERLELLNETGQFYNEPANLRGWWLYAMLEGGHPLREKLTLFWHNHFATSNAKVRTHELMFEQNVTLRKHALGNFRPFLLDMSKDPAMLVWLDSNQQREGQAERELRPRGDGTVLARRRQLHREGHPGGGPRVHRLAPRRRGAARSRTTRVLHDDGEKTVLGKTGNWNGDDVVRICWTSRRARGSSSASCTPSSSARPPPPTGCSSRSPSVPQVGLRHRRARQDDPRVAALLLRARLPQAGEVAGRVRASGAVRAVVPARVPLADLVDPLAKMGQVLFAPPNVKGWRTGTDWLNSATLLARNNFAETVAMGEWSKGTSRPRGNRVPDCRASRPTAGGRRARPRPAAAGREQDPVALVYAAKPKDIAGGREGDGRTASTARTSPRSRRRSS